MSHDNGDMDRRTVLKGAGAAGAAALTGGAGIAALSGSAAAASMSFSAGVAQVSNDDGSVSEVYIAPALSATWENFDTAVEQVEVSIDWGVDDDGDGGIADTELDGNYTDTFAPDTAGTTGDWSIAGNMAISLYGGDSGNSTDEFESNTDGETQVTSVVLDVTVSLLDANGNLVEPNAEAELSAADTFDAKAINEQASASGDGTANTGMS